MRFLIVMLLVGCGTTDRDGQGDGDAGVVPDADQCPAELDDGATCSFEGRCWRQNGFSSCMSAWCTCAGGRVTCEEIDAREGQACGDEPITACSYEGNPGCDTAPTAEGCACQPDGTWRCTCACYGGMSTCGIDACTRTPAELSGRPCGDHGQVCSFPGVSCRCEEQNDGTWAFACS